MRFRCRDFIETENGLVFAVNAYLHPKDRVIGFLRFVGNSGRYRKLGTTTAGNPAGRLGVSPSAQAPKLGTTLDSYNYLSKHHPEYLYNSKVAGIALQAIPLDKIKKVIRPDEFLTGLRPDDDFKASVLELTKILSEKSNVPLKKFGVTGSVLVGAHTLDSDIDLVVYGLDNFNMVRKSLAGLVEAGLISELGTTFWRQWYEKRLPGCELSLEEFMFHAARKNNSGVYKGTKFDVLYARDWNEINGSYGSVRYKKLGTTSTFNKGASKVVSSPSARYHIEKLGTTKVKAKVIDDTLAFDYPAIYKVKSIEGQPVKEIVSYTHSYAGQAFKGETVLASGILEEVHGKGVKYLRLLVGSTREAKGEYIKVVSKKP